MFVLISYITYVCRWCYSWRMNTGNISKQFLHDFLRNIEFNSIIVCFDAKTSFFRMIFDDLHHGFEVFILRYAKRLPSLGFLFVGDANGFTINEDNQNSGENHHKSTEKKSYLLKHTVMRSNSMLLDNLAKFYR